MQVDSLLLKGIAINTSTGPQALSHACNDAASVRLSAQYTRCFLLPESRWSVPLLSVRNLRCFPLSSIDFRTRLNRLLIAS